MTSWPATRRGSPPAVRSIALGARGDEPVEGRRCRTYQPGWFAGRRGRKKRCAEQEETVLAMGQGLEMGVQPRFARSSFAEGSGHRTRLRPALFRATDDRRHHLPAHGHPGSVLTSAGPDLESCARRWRSPTRGPTCELGTGAPTSNSRSELVERPCRPLGGLPDRQRRRSDLGTLAVQGSGAHGGARSGKGRGHCSTKTSGREGLPPSGQTPNDAARTLHERLAELASISVTGQVI
jgi:hypothetical protein